MSATAEDLNEYTREHLIHSAGYELIRRVIGFHLCDIDKSPFSFGGDQRHWKRRIIDHENGSVRGGTCGRPVPGGLPEESEKRHSEAFEETTQADTKIAEPEEEPEENNDDYYDDIIGDQEQEILELKEQIESLQNQLSGKSKQKISLSDKVREVEIVFPDGSTTKRTGTNIILDGNYCLVAPGGKTYHSLVSCYLNWPEEFRNSFSHWNIITKEEAKQQNLKECKFCKESRKLKESIDNEIMLCDEELIEALKRNHSFEEFRQHGG